MSKATDTDYLKNDQYRDSSNLDARVEIHRRFSTNPYGWFRWVFDSLTGLPENAVVLELGCGPGLLWKENADRIPAGWDVTLSDLSSGMLDAAWRNLVVLSRPFRFGEIDAQSIPCGDASFDAVIANHMLYHVPDRDAAIREFRRVLKPCGRLSVATVGEHHHEEMHRWLDRVSVNHSFESFIGPFTLENGLEQLRPYFPDVTLRRYPDELHLTDLAAIEAYVRSMIPAAELSETELACLRQELGEALRDGGMIRVRKDSGLFEARK